MVIHSFLRTTYTTLKTYVLEQPSFSEAQNTGKLWSFLPWLWHTFKQFSQNLVKHALHGHAFVRQELFDEPRIISSGSSHHIHATQRSKATIYQELTMLFPRLKPRQTQGTQSPKTPHKDFQVVKADSLTTEAKAFPLKVSIPASQGYQSIALTYAEPLLETPTTAIMLQEPQRLEPMVIHRSEVTQKSPTFQSAIVSEPHRKELAEIETMELMVSVTQEKNESDDVMYPITLRNKHQTKPVWEEVSRYNDFYLQHLSNRSRLLSLQEALQERLE